VERRVHRDSRDLAARVFREAMPPVFRGRRVRLDFRVREARERRGIRVFRVLRVRLVRRARWGFRELRVLRVRRDRRVRLDRRVRRVYQDYRVLREMMGVLLLFGRMVTVILLVRISE
jgi:hypothetical protein